MKLLFPRYKEKEFYDFYKPTEDDFSDELDGEYEILNAIHIGELKAVVRDSLGKLSERQEAMVRLYFFYDLSFGAIGEKYNLSNSRVAQIVSKSIRKLRNKNIIGYNLREYL